MNIGCVPCALKPYFLVPRNDDSIITRDYLYLQLIVLRYVKKKKVIYETSQFQMKFWAAAFFIMIVANMAETASTNLMNREINRHNTETENLNEARSKAMVNDALAQRLFEYLLDQYKTKADIVQKRMSRRLNRSSPWNALARDKDENNFDGLAIAAGVVLFVVIVARVGSTLIEARNQFFGRQSDTDHPFEQEKLLRMTENILQSMEKFQRKINNF